MNKPITVIPKVLVIDDHKRARDDVRRFLKIPNLREHGIEDFTIAEAGSPEEAESLLSQTHDLVFLDLNLKESSDSKLNLEPGFWLLNLIKERQAAKGVVIISGYPSHDNALRTMKGGALDFLQKPFHKPDFEAAALSAIHRIMVDDSNRILNQRIRDLVSYAEIGLAHSFKRVFAGLLEGITESASEIERYVGERYGLDKETSPKDALILNLQSHHNAVARARQEWAGLQAELGRGGKTLEVDRVGKILSVIRDNLTPCLAVKRVVFGIPESDNSQVLTFENDVEVALQEIIVGALSELPDYGDEVPLTVTVTSEDARAVVIIEDNFNPIPEEAANAINQKQRIIPDAKFGRSWGLSVAQHVALRGGGELKVSSEGGRNVVAYYVPLAE